MAQQNVNLFLDSLKSKHSKHQYEFHWKRFQEAAPTTETEPKLLTKHIISYLVEMKQEGLSYSYRNLTLAAIRHHYSMEEEIVLNWDKIHAFLGENEAKNELRGYTREEIRRMLAISDVQQKALILALVSTGMRREAAMNIKLKDMTYLEEYKLYRIKIYIRSKSQQICYTTPEAAEAIKLYLTHKRATDKLFDYDNAESISTILRLISVKANVSHHHVKEDEASGQFRHEIPAAHGLRKFAITQMAAADKDKDDKPIKDTRIPTEIAKVLTGHSIGVRGKYVEYTEDDLLQEYLKAVNRLSINQEHNLQIQVDDLVKEKDNEIAQLKKQMAEMQKTLQMLASKEGYKSV